MFKITIYGDNNEGRSEEIFSQKVNLLDVIAVIKAVNGIMDNYSLRNTMPITVPQRKWTKEELSAKPGNCCGLCSNFTLRAGSFCIGDCKVFGEEKDLSGGVSCRDFTSRAFIQKSSEPATPASVVDEQSDSPFNAEWLCAACLHWIKSSGVEGTCSNRSMSMRGDEASCNYFIPGPQTVVGGDSNNFKSPMTPVGELMAYCDELEKSGWTWKRCACTDRKCNMVLFYPPTGIIKGWTSFDTAKGFPVEVDSHLDNLVKACGKKDL